MDLRVAHNHSIETSSNLVPATKQERFYSDIACGRCVSKL